MKQNKAQPTLSLSLSLSAKSTFRGIPEAMNGVSYAITAAYGEGGMSVANFMRAGHYVKQGVMAIYETE